MRASRRGAYVFRSSSCAPVDGHSGALPMAGPEYGLAAWGCNNGVSDLSSGAVAGHPSAIAPTMGAGVGRTLALRREDFCHRRRHGDGFAAGHRGRPDLRSREPCIRRLVVAQRSVGRCLVVGGMFVLAIRRHSARSSLWRGALRIDKLFSLARRRLELRHRRCLFRRLRGCCQP